MFGSTARYIDIWCPKSLNLSLDSLLAVLHWEVFKAIAYHQILWRSVRLWLCEVPRGLTSQPNFASTWREEQSLRTWQKNMTILSTLGTTSKRYQRTEHILEHQTFIVNNRRDAVFMLRLQCVNDSFCWCIKDLTFVKTTDERYLTLQPFLASWEHDENQVICSKSQAHHSLHLWEFDAFGSLRAGCGLQLPRLLRVIEQRSLSFHRSGVVDLLTALLWQVGPSCRQEIPLDKFLPRKGEEWLRQSMQQMSDENFAKKLCHHVHRLLKNAEDNWTNDQVLLCICYIARCIVEHAASGTPALFGSCFFGLF